MKKMSLKIKLTVLYSFFMILISGLALAILFSLSSRQILASTQSMLKDQVTKSLDYLEIEDGRLIIDSDFYSLEHDVYLAIYSVDLEFLYGKVPQRLDAFPVLADGELQTVKEGNETWYTFDIFYKIEKDMPVFVRGVTSSTKAESDFRITVRLAVILFPLMILFTSLIGYRIVRRALQPVRVLTQTVDNIRKEGDLSLRTGEYPDTDKDKDEIRYLAETFDQMLEQLENTFLREKQFTSDVSHELRTPISVILAQSEMLLADDSLSEEQRRKIQVVYQKGKQMTGLISQLLILSRADQGNARLTLECLNISELTEMTAEEQRESAENRKIKLITEIDEEIYAEVDETAYFRMVMNLISNAVYYGKTGGTVWISLHQREGKAVLEVRDNGIGMSSEVLPHIWERFYRADPSRTDGNHSGLGLSMVKWIVEMHKGEIQVESEPGIGSKFTVLLPVCKK